MDAATSKNKKKKQKNKLKTILRGVASEPLVIVSGKQSERFKMTLKCLASLPRSSDATVVEDEKSKNKMLKKDLVFGVNEIMRHLRKSECNISGLVVTNPLSSHLQLTLHEVSLAHKVPCFSLDGLHDMSNQLNLSSLTVIAFKTSCKDPGSAFHSLYKLFMNIYEEKTGARVENSQISNVQKFPKCVESSRQPEHKRIIRPKADELYDCIENRKLFPNSIVSSSSAQSVDSDCISIANNEIYFPVRHSSDDLVEVAHIKSMECDYSADQSFTMRLVDTPRIEPSTVTMGESSNNVKYFKSEVMHIQSCKRDNKRKRKQKIKK